MIKKLKTFINLTENPSGLWLFLKIGFWVYLVSTIIHIFSLPRLLKFITPSKPSKKKWEKEKLNNLISFWLGRRTLFLRSWCLRRSLVLYRYLRLQGEPAQIFFGMRKEQGELKGHAWLMIDGKPFMDNEDLNYQVVYSYPEKKGRGEGELEELSRVMD